MSMLMTFDPAALDSFDIKNGDENVICFGTNHICELAKKRANVTIKIPLRYLYGLSNTFVKICDLGFVGNVEKTISFKGWSFTLEVKNPMIRQLTIKYGSNTWTIPLYSLEDRLFAFHGNIRTINAFFASYIFKLLDLYANLNLNSSFLKTLKSVSPKNQAAFLAEIGKILSCCSEVNISGALRLDFSDKNVEVLQL